MNVIKKSLFQFPSDLNTLDRVLSSFSELNQPFIPTKVWLQCELALAEAFTNAVRHAHKNLSPETPIDVEVTLFTEHLEMRIWDRGQPFDLEQHFRNLPDPVNEIAEGGRGIAILNQIADDLSYKRTEDDRNCLLIVKHYR